MTDAPPPQMPPPPQIPPPPAVPPRDPGFFVCGVLFIVALIVVSGIAAGVGELTNYSPWGSGTVSLLAVAVAFYFAVRDPRFAKCLIKGIAATVVIGVVLFGVCVAAFSSMY